MSFVYPDFRTVLRGRFERGRMEGARLAEVREVVNRGELLGMDFNQKGGAEDFFARDVSNRTHLSKHPMIR